MRQMFTSAQEGSADDMNNVSSRLERQIYDRLIKNMLGLDNGFFADGLKVVFGSSTSVSVTPGIGFQTDNTQADNEPVYRQIRLAAAKVLVIDAADINNDRIDLIVVKSDRFARITATRKSKTPQQSIAEDKTLEVVSDWTSDFLVVKGTAQIDPVAPAIPSGYIELAECVVTGGSGLALGGLTDERAVFTDLSNVVTSEKVTEEFADRSLTPGQDDDGKILVTKQGGFDLVDQNDIPSGIGGIISSAIQSHSSMPQFLEISASGLTGKVLGAVTSLVLRIKNRKVIIDSDLNLNLTAGPSTLNSGAINDSKLAGDNISYNAGEPDLAYSSQHGILKNELRIDGAGSAITTRVGQWASFSIINVSGTQVIHAFIESATKITNVRREWFFDSDDDGIITHPIYNNNPLTLLGTCWLYADQAGAVHQSYKSAIIDDRDLVAGNYSSGDVWFRPSNEQYYIHSGGIWVAREWEEIGMMVMNSSKVMGYRCKDPVRNYQSINNSEWERISATRMRATRNASLSSYGEMSNVHVGDYFDMVSDIIVGDAELGNRKVFMYKRETGHNERSFNRSQWRPELKGYYHPFRAWRAVAESFNNASSDLVDEYTYFPWQRYNPNGKTPESFKIRVDISSSKVPSISYASPPFSPTTLYKSANLYYVDAPTNFFRAIPHVIIGPIRDVTGNLGGNYVDKLDGTFTIARMTFDIEHAGNKLFITYSFVAQDLEQVILDNSLQG